MAERENSTCLVLSSTRTIISIKFHRRQWGYVFWLFFNRIFEPPLTLVRADYVHFVSNNTPTKQCSAPKSGFGLHRPFPTKCGVTLKRVLDWVTDVHRVCHTQNIGGSTIGMMCTSFRKCNRVISSHILPSQQGLKLGTAQQIRIKSLETYT